MLSWTEKKIDSTQPNYVKYHKVHCKATNETQQIKYSMLFIVMLV